jgi:hypothetical protein
MGDNISKKQGVEGAREFEQEKSGERDSSKEFARAEHQAHEDAVGTEFEVRPAKNTPTESSSKDETESSSEDDSESSSEDSEGSEDAGDSGDSGDGGSE